MKPSIFYKIVSFGGYGFVIVVSSFLFFYVGLEIDEYFNTKPSFMLGFLILAVFMAIGKLIQNALYKDKK